ncbi:hypothetical protein HDF16_001780 [Granulicella aggregans]|uniref:Transmembrane protein n=1 Tax=Granulicella aggregans TaxID=474949 RepID=A0A7W8E4F6_9BACT|nr:hypothetical protein [Granulicella aggregans]MBB5057095.1 hypothetical protein [Granulicella aggregans]
MTEQRPKFSFAVHIYLWGFFALLCLSPLGVLIELNDRVSVPTSWWVASLSWPVILAALFSYSMRRCSSGSMTYTDGLLWITRSMMTGWSTISFVVVPPALFTAFLGSVAIAASGDLQRRPHYARTKWASLVTYFYRQRMRR